MRHSRFVALAAAALLASSPAAPAQDFSKVEIKSEKVADGVWMLTGAGGNIGVSAGLEGVFLIDDQYAPLTGRIKAAVGAISDKPIRFVLNTHCHPDHVGGNENLGQDGVLIVAHDNVRRRMSVEQVSTLFGRTTPAAPALALPVVTFADTVTFHLNGDDVVAVHVPPAHTDGDAVIRFRKANVIHAGDCFFNGLYPVIDLDAGGSIDGMIGAAGRILAMADAQTRIIPGHGPLADRAALEAYLAMLKGVRAKVAAEVEAGKTLEQTLADKPTAAFDDPWGKSFMKPETFVKVVYTDLSRRAGKR